MRLFKYDAYIVKIEPEALLLKPFKKIWQRDKSKSKDLANMELAYIYFFCDPRSDYQYLVDEEQRTKAIIEGEGLPDRWKPDKLVLDAIDFYNQFKPASALLLEDTRFMVDRFRNRMKEIVNQEELGVKELKDISAMIKQIPGLVKDLDEAERAIAKEIVQNENIRGNQEKSMYEDL